MRRRPTKEERAAVKKFFDDIWDAVVPSFSNTALRYLKNSRRDMPPRLLHFTDMAGVEAILSKKTLRLTRARSSNDSGELRYGLDLGRQCLEEISRKEDWPQLFKREVESCWDGKYFGEDHDLPDPHICCLSVASAENERSIPHWAMYGKSGAGAALVFDGHKLRTRTNVDCVRVIYDPQRQKRLMTSALKRGLRMCAEGRIKANAKHPPAAEYVYRTLAHATGAYASLLAAAMKDPDFRFEDEWRLMVYYLPVDVSEEEERKLLRFSAHASGNIIKSSYTLPIAAEDLKGVIVGPSASELNQPVVKMLLRYNKFDPKTEVRIGTTALRSRPQ